MYTPCLAGSTTGWYTATSVCTSNHVQQSTTPDYDYPTSVQTNPTAPIQSWNMRATDLFHGSGDQRLIGGTPRPTVSDHLPVFHSTCTWRPLEQLVSYSLAASLRLQPGWPARNSLSLCSVT